MTRQEFIETLKQAKENNPEAYVEQNEAGLRFCVDGTMLCPIAFCRYDEDKNIKYALYMHDNPEEYEDLLEEDITLIVWAADIADINNYFGHLDERVIPTRNEMNKALGLDPIRQEA